MKKLFKKIWLFVPIAPFTELGCLGYNLQGISENIIYKLDKKKEEVVNELYRDLHEDQ